MAQIAAAFEEDESGAMKPLVHHKADAEYIAEQFKPVKRRIAHFKVSSALRPHQAVEVSLDRAKQQLEIYELLKQLSETAKNIPAVNQ